MPKEKDHKKKDRSKISNSKNSDKEAILRFQIEAEESEPEIWESSEIEDLKRILKAVDLEKNQIIILKLF
uniref:Uncharacterized protein n=1 Tax=candidate division WOR-3 bacterium TaxID=2052148 RepID=A0A7V3ZTZ7_UNCW3